MLGAALPALAAANEPPEVPAAPKPAAKQALPENGVVVIEDDSARIEETRRRGQVVRVQVHSKVGGVAGYEISLRPGRDLSAPPTGTTGRSAWQLLSF